MEERKKKAGLLLRIFQRLASSKLSMKEYIFAIVVTLMQIGSPFVYELIRGDSQHIWQVPITGVLLFLVFVFMWNPEEFLQKNLVEFIFFQIITIVVTIVLASPAVFHYRDEIKSLYEFEIWGFEGYWEGAILLGYFVLIVVGAFLIYEVLAGIFLWLFTIFVLEDFRNPYFEQIRAARSLENYEEYQKRMFREAYEKMAEETVYRPKPLFEHTKFFKQITEIEQVKPRYHAMMKIYHPDNPGGSVDITQELQKEYQEIAKKYNL